MSQGKGVYHSLPKLLKEDGICPAVMFKMVQSCIHYDEDRLLNIRELLHLMGMPHDFELQGDKYRGYAQIGQNVPVRTTYWIISEALRAYERENDLDENNTVRFFDNIKQSEIKYEH
jgi:site-specific DNA-cytosine methylase